MNAATPGLGYDPADLTDIPGTTIFTTASSRRAYHLHRFCHSLAKPEARAAFKADEAGYLSGYALSDEQREAVLARDYNRLIALGGSFFFLIKLASTDGWSAQRAVSTMSGMSVDDYAAMMIAGGRSPEGNRSIKGKY
ncbi:protocatechuate 4,5-dioxygenase subunit alpha [Sphingomonas arantia]|uniref:Protocatechuate 4,5-dioxygenase subunit alpha n=1 Tax=Sphingomonas arantia TaxID=1460676 RepID=A0ABW4TT25_9SPHN